MVDNKKLLKSYTYYDLIKQLCNQLFGKHGADFFFLEMNHLVVWFLCVSVDGVPSLCEDACSIIYPPTGGSRWGGWCVRRQDYHHIHMTGTHHKHVQMQCRQNSEKD